MPVEWAVNSAEADPPERAGAPGSAGSEVPTTDLSAWGWTGERERAFAVHASEGFVPGRVIAQQRDSLRAITPSGTSEVTIQRGFRRTAIRPSDFPVTGDWLVLETFPDGSGHALREILPRTSAFSRREAEGSGRVEEQVLAANVDTVFIVAALTGDFNVRRIERYLALAWSSGAQPAIVLNKLDLCPDVESRLADVYAVAGDAPVHAVSARTGEGLPALRRYLTPGATVVLLGSSGAGKSTMTNALLGAEVQLVRDVREDDDRGRHTTTGRELFPLPGGALLIDTPGLRSVGLWDAEGGLDSTFADIEAIENQCRFSDCRHEAGPGCAVQAALAAGTLSHDRLASRQKLERELRSLERRASPHTERAAGRAFGKMVKGIARHADWKQGVIE